MAVVWSGVILKVVICFFYDFYDFDWDYFDNYFVQKMCLKNLVGCFGELK